MLIGFILRLGPASSEKTARTTSMRSSSIEPGCGHFRLQVSKSSLVSSITHKLTLPATTRAQPKRCYKGKPRLQNVLTISKQATPYGKQCRETATQPPPFRQTDGSSCSSGYCCSMVQLACRHHPPEAFVRWLLDIWRNSIAMRHGRA
jgi:hypothetical protein